MNKNSLTASMGVQQKQQDIKWKVELPYDYSLHSSRCSFHSLDTVWKAKGAQWLKHQILTYKQFYLSKIGGKTDLQTFC